MNCRAAQRLLSAERDRAPGAEATGPLADHLAGCAECRQLRATWTEAAESWRTTTAEARLPDARLEWQRLRRRLHEEADGAGSDPKRAGWSRLTLWRGMSLAGAAAAAVVIGFFALPRQGAPGQPRASGVVASTAADIPGALVTADSVEVAGDSTSAMVYLDEPSGWTVVWVAGAAD